MFKKLRAFTMAEAILVMTILGIIATIMISTLKPAEYKEKSMQIMAKKVLSQIDVATTQIIMNDTVDGTFDTLIDISGNIITRTNIMQSKDLANLYKKYLTAIRKTPEVSTGSMARFVLKDGTAVGIFLYPADFLKTVENTIFPGETQMLNAPNAYGYIFYDINDNESPNVFGKDRYKLPLGKYGIMYAD